MSSQGEASGARRRATRTSYDAVARAYARQVGPLAASDDEMAAEFDRLVAQARAARGGAPTVIDAGCGPGWWSHRMAAAGAHVVGLDVSPVMAHVAAGERLPPREGVGSSPEA